MVCRCARRAQELGPQGDRHVPGANCGAAGAPAPLSQNCSACRSGEQTGIGSVCASALCCHPADLPLSTSLCTHGKNIGKLGTGKRRNGEYAEAFSMNVEVLWQKMRKRNMSCTFHAPAANRPTAFWTHVSSIHCNKIRILRVAVGF